MSHTTYITRCDAFSPCYRVNIRMDPECIRAQRMVSTIKGGMVVARGPHQHTRAGRKEPAAPLTLGVMPDRGAALRF
jgi:hypothetical protein